MKHRHFATSIVATAALLSILLAGAGCSNKKSRDFFSADGVVVGTPVLAGKQTYRIPIDFKTEIVHSGLAIDKVTTTVKDAEILVTASYKLESGNYPGYIELSDLPPGTYLVKYRDPDGTRHSIGSVTIP